MESKYYLDNDKLLFSYLHDRYSKSHMLADFFGKGYVKIHGLVFKEEDIFDDKTKRQLKSYKHHHTLLGKFPVEKYDFEFEEDDELYDEIDEDFGQTEFCIGVLKEEFVYLNKSIFGLSKEFAIDKGLLSKKINKHFFSIYTDFGRTLVPTAISEYSKSDCYIVFDDDTRLGQNGYISISSFENLIDQFPTQTELKHYKYARIANCISEFFDKDDYLEKYHNYMNKKLSYTRSFSYNAATEIDVEKYKYIIKEINSNLKNTKISEEEWQKKLTKIICLLYPQYVICLSKVPVQYCDDAKN